MRGTLHFVAAADVRWMLELLTPRIVAASEKRRLDLELDAKVFKRSAKIFTTALQGGRQLTRGAIHALLEKGRIAMSPQRSYHIFWKHAQEGLICFAAHEGKQPTFALLEEWIPAAKRWEREAALAELAKRYFTGHGPATLRDFVWWTGLRAADAKAAVGLVSGQLASETVEGKTFWMSRELPPLNKLPCESHLLPGFDEYMLGYTDRSAALEPRFAPRICPGSNGIFSPTVVIAGKFVGTWKRTVKKREALITPTGFASLTKAQVKTLDAPAERYGNYLGMRAKIAD